MEIHFFLHPGGNPKRPKPYKTKWESISFGARMMKPIEAPETAEPIEIHFFWGREEETSTKTPKEMENR